MNWQELAHDKKLWIGSGLAAALGLGVWYQRKKSGQTAQSTATPSGTTPVGVAYTGGFDSTGTDVASWLGNYSQNLQNQLDQYQKQLTDTLGGTAAIGNTTTGAIPNDQWGTAAFNWLATNNKWSTGLTPTMAQLAINDYLGGKASVPDWEKWTINEVLTGRTQGPQGGRTLGKGLAPPAQLPGVPWV